MRRCNRQGVTAIIKGYFSSFSMITYDVIPHYNWLDETFLMKSHMYESIKNRENYSLITHIIPSYL